MDEEKWRKREKVTLSSSGWKEVIIIYLVFYLLLPTPRAVCHLPASWALHFEAHLATSKVRERYRAACYAARFGANVSFRVVDKRLV